MKRRSFLAGIVSVLYACRSVVSNKQIEPSDSNEIDSAVEEEDCLPQSLSISFDEYPELNEIGGSAWVSFPEQFVHVLVVCLAEQHWIAVWKICTHGTCDVEWDESLSVIRCPCHNSLFDIDGRVLEGPAERDLKEYSVCREGNMLFLSSV